MITDTELINEQLRTCTSTLPIQQYKITVHYEKGNIEFSNCGEKAVMKFLKQIKKKKPFTVSITERYSETVIFPLKINFIEIDKE